MQHKCVEMSITLTAALAAALFALLSKTVLPGKLLVAVLGVYSLIQSLILANYIYHTFMVNLITKHIDGLTRHIGEPICKSIADSPCTPTDSSEQFATTVTNRLQPLIIYCSILFSWFFFAISLLWYCWRLSVCLSCSALLVVVLLACVDLCLYKLHTRTDQLSRCWCWMMVNCSEKDVGIWKVWSRFWADRRKKRV